jgi:PAS domain S-box-containing protein
MRDPGGMCAALHSQVISWVVLEGIALLALGAWALRLFLEARRNDQRTRRRAESLEHELAEAQAISHVGSWRMDLQEGRLICSEELARILGVHPRLSLALEECLPLVHPDDLEQCREMAHWLLRTTNPFAYELRVRRPDGERLIHIRTRLHLVDGKAHRLVGTAEDVTERRQLELRLATAEHLRSVGALAAGVAHEINNPLSYVMANLDLALEELATAGGHGEMVEELAEARAGAGRIRDVVRDLKTFSRTESEHRGPVDLKAVLELAANMAGNEIRHRAALVKSLGDLPPVDGNDSRLGQVFLNLLVNAAQAIAVGQAAAHRITLTSRLDGDHAVVEISDTGCGMSPEVQARIFEPFFTTKPVGVGTGLGMSICQSIVSQYGGEMAIESAVGRGTTVRVKLRTCAPAQVQPAAPKAAVAHATGRRVLIIDDEPAVARSVGRAINRSHQVTLVNRGAEALALVERGEQFDAILCDLMMPELTGMELYQRIREIAPQQAERMMFMTGGVFTDDARQFLETVSSPVLEKPFETAQFIEALDRFSARFAEKQPSEPRMAADFP